MAIQRGENEVAAAELEAAARLMPNERAVYATLARAYQRSGHSELALQAAEAARQASEDHVFVDPRHGALMWEAVNVRSFRVRGKMLQDAGRFDRALAEFRRGLVYAPSDLTLHRRVIGVLLGQRDYRSAVKAYREALRFEPNDATLARGMAVALIALNRYAEAETRLRSSLAIDPEDTVLANELAWLLATCPDSAIRNGGEATRLAEGVMARPKRRTAETLDTLAAAYAETGRFGDALRVMEEAINLLEQRSDAGPALGRYRGRLELYRSHQPYRLTELYADQIQRSRNGS